MTKRGNKMANLAYRYKSDLRLTLIERIYSNDTRDISYMIFSSLAGKRTQRIVAIDRNQGKKDIYIYENPTDCFTPAAHARTG